MSNLEKVTCCFLIAVCIMSMTVLVKHEFFTVNASALGGQAAMLVGKSEPGVPTAMWQGSQRNVVLLLSSQCHFCEESMPLYQRLSSLRRRGRFSLLVVGMEPPKSLAEYLRQNGVAADKVLQLHSGFSGINFTPAVFIVDSHGVIQKAFLGKLNSSDETLLLHLVGG